jgi:hypothetical protein
MAQTTSEVIRVSTAGARILGVTQERIEYIDMAGQGQVVDLKECARNYVRWYDEHRREFLPLCGASQVEIDAEVARCVGQRGGPNPLWWIELMNGRKTRFEFETWEASVMQLQGPLMVARWNTFDTG